jgi:hypothetical protein
MRGRDLGGEGRNRVERERKIGKRDIHVDKGGRNRIERRGS